MSKEISEMDKRFYEMAREHIDIAMLSFLTSMVVKPGKALVIGPRPQDKWWRFSNVDTLDIVPDARCTFTADITKRIPVEDSTYDMVGCWEVLEHTLQPFDAVAEIRRILKPGGILLASTPLNFRIHGPANDCFRFTEHGIRVLMKDFDALTFSILEAPDRFLFPINYAWTAVCNKTKNVTDIEKTFRWIE